MNETLNVAILNFATSTEKRRAELHDDPWAHLAQPPGRADAIRAAELRIQYQRAKRRKR